MPDGALLAECLLFELVDKEGGQLALTSIGRTFTRPLMLDARCRSESIGHWRVDCGFDDGVLNTSLSATFLLYICIPRATFDYLRIVLVFVVRPASFMVILAVRALLLCVFPVTRLWFTLQRLTVSYRLRYETTSL